MASPDCHQLKFNEHSGLGMLSMPDTTHQSALGSSLHNVTYSASCLSGPDKELKTSAQTRAFTALGTAQKPVVVAHE